ncbi:hypothetical protein SDC9_06421 [bioreactor metagenome]|uniref:Uncharacterized protein n=1 Tax=bioreactor metagenome TaxID=1076179 RepID=A0A644T272_9ZZZZ
MDRLGARAIDDGRRVGIEAEEARVGGGGDGAARQCLAGGAQMRAVDRVDRGAGLGRAVVRERIALGHEAVIDELGQGVAQEGIGAGGVADHRLDLGAGGGQVLPRIDRDAQVEDAPGGHRARPVAAGDAADVQVHRVMRMGEIGMAAGRSVPARLEPVQGLDQREGRLNRIRAAAGIGDMGRQAAQMHLTPDHPELRGDEAFLEGLGDQCRIGAIAAQQTGKGAVAGAFLLDHRLHEDIGRRLQPERAQRIEREEVRGEPGLHVARAAAVKPAVLDAGREGRGAPHLLGACRHHIDMAVQDQRAALAAAAAMAADDVPGVLIGGEHGREAGLVADLVKRDLPAVDGKATGGHLICHEGLRALLVAAGRGMRGQFAQEVDLALEERVDRREDAGGKVGVHGDASECRDLARGQGEGGAGRLLHLARGDAAGQFAQGEARRGDVDHREIGEDPRDMGGGGQRQRAAGKQLRIALAVGVGGQHHHPPRLLRKLDRPARPRREPPGDLPVRQIAGLGHLEGAEHGQVEPARAHQRKAHRAVEIGRARDRRDIGAAGIDQVAVCLGHGQRRADAGHAVLGVQADREARGQVVDHLGGQADAEVHHHARGDLAGGAGDHAPARVGDLIV